MKRAILFMIMALGGVAQASDTAVAQAHARKANGLAAAGKCKQAIPEFNAAYKALKDPALLFNRAECLRKLGKGKEALFDYRKFLEEMPSAPNRDLVQSRIVALDPEAAVPKTKTIVQAPAVETPARVSPTPTPTVSEPPALHAAALRAPLPAPEPPPAPAAPMLVERAPAPAPAPPSSDGRAWLYLSLAAVVVAAAAGGALYVTGKPRNQ